MGLQSLFQCCYFNKLGSCYIIWVVNTVPMISQTDNLIGWYLTEDLNGWCNRRAVTMLEVRHKNIDQTSSPAIVLISLIFKTDSILCQQALPYQDRADKRFIFMLHFDTGSITFWYRFDYILIPVRFGLNLSPYR